LKKIMAQSPSVTLYFRSKIDNNPESLYVVNEDDAWRTALVFHPDIDAVLATEWQKWHISLSDIQAEGVDMSYIKKMYIGVGDHESPQPGGEGKIYIDDILITDGML
jgi:hypothetical protein